MSKGVHRSRLQTFIARPVPDLLKAAYMFGGQSLTQMMKPPVENWLSTRGNIGHLIKAYATLVLATNMGQVLNSGNDATGVAQAFMRAAVFNQTRDNRSLLMIDKLQEDLKSVSHPLGGLSDLQAQGPYVARQGYPAQAHQEISRYNKPYVNVQGMTRTGGRRGGKSPVAICGRSALMQVFPELRPAKIA